MYARKNFPPRKKRKRWVPVVVVLSLIAVVWFWNFRIAPFMRENSAVKEIQIVGLTPPTKIVSFPFEENYLAFRNGETVQLSEDLIVVYYGEAHDHLFGVTDGFQYFRVNKRFFYQSHGNCWGEYRIPFQNKIENIDFTFLYNDLIGKGFVERGDLSAK